MAARCRKDGEAEGVQFKKNVSGTVRTDVGKSQFYSKHGIVAIRDSGADSDNRSSVSGIKVRRITRMHEGVTRFPKLEECAHFHYEFVELGKLEVSLCSEHDEGTKHYIEDADKNQPAFVLKVASHEKVWLVRRTYDDFRTLDKQLHRCIYDRKYSMLPELRRNEFKDEMLTATRKLLTMYVNRFSSIACNSINCGPVLGWFELDNRGNRLIVADESDINTPAIAAAHVVKRYQAQAPDELSFEVGDILSIIDMPPSQDTLWWRGKKITCTFEVGFFPSESVELIGDINKIPQAMVSKIPQTPPKPVLRKRGKLISFLRTFFSNRPARNTLKREGIVKERVFGCDLGEHLLNSGHDVPLVLKCCTEVIESHGIVDGIYRLSGVASNIHKLRVAFDEDQVPDLTSDTYLQDIHSISSLLKMYFRELPNPLLTYLLYDKFSEAVKDENDQLFKMYDAIQQLPPPHYRTTEYLMRHLSRVAAYGAETGMHHKNLAIVWAPNLLRSKELEANCSLAALQGVSLQAVVTEFLIRNVDILFSDQSPNVANGDNTANGKRSRPKSLAISTPTKLLSLEEARERAQSISSGSQASQKYIEVGGGPSALPDTYHTVIDIPGHKKKGKREKHSTGGLRSIFSRNKTQTWKRKDSTEIDDSARVVPLKLSTREDKEEDVVDKASVMRRLRSVQSADSLLLDSKRKSLRGTTIANPYAVGFDSKEGTTKSEGSAEIKQRPKRSLSFEPKTRMSQIEAFSSDDVFCNRQICEDEDIPSPIKISTTAELLSELEGRLQQSERSMDDGDSTNYDTDLYQDFQMQSDFESIMTRSLPSGSEFGHQYELQRSRSADPPHELTITPSPPKSLHMSYIGHEGGFDQNMHVHMSHVSQSDGVIARRYMPEDCPPPLPPKESRNSYISPDSESSATSVIASQGYEWQKITSDFNTLSSKQALGLEDVENQNMTSHLEEQSLGELSKMDENTCSLAGTGYVDQPGIDSQDMENAMQDEAPGSPSATQRLVSRLSQHLDDIEVAGIEGAEAEMAPIEAIASGVCRGGMDKGASVSSLNSFRSDECRQVRYFPDCEQAISDEMTSGGSDFDNGLLSADELNSHSDQSFTRSSKDSSPRISPPEPGMMPDDESLTKLWSHDHDAIAEPGLLHVLPEMKETLGKSHSMPSVNEESGSLVSNKLEGAKSLDSMLESDSKVLMHDGNGAKVLVRQTAMDQKDKSNLPVDSEGQGSRGILQTTDGATNISWSSEHLMTRPFSPSDLRNALTDSGSIHIGSSSSQSSTLEANTPCLTSESQRSSEISPAEDSVILYEQLPKDDTLTDIASSVSDTKGQRNLSLNAKASEHEVKDLTQGGESQLSRIIIDSSNVDLDVPQTDIDQVTDLSDEDSQSVSVDVESPRHFINPPDHLSTVPKGHETYGKDFVQDSQSKSIPIKSAEEEIYDRGVDVDRSSRVVLEKEIIIKDNDCTESDIHSKDGQIGDDVKTLPVVPARHSFHETCTNSKQASSDEIMHAPEYSRPHGGLSYDAYTSRNVNMRHSFHAEFSRPAPFDASTRRDSDSEKEDGGACSLDTTAPVLHSSFETLYCRSRNKNSEDGGDFNSAPMSQSYSGPSSTLPGEFSRSNQGGLYSNRDSPLPKDLKGQFMMRAGKPQPTFQKKRSYGSDDSVVALHVNQRQLEDFAEEYPPHLDQDPNRDNTKADSSFAYNKDWDVVFQSPNIGSRNSVPEVFDHSRIEPLSSSDAGTRKDKNTDSCVLRVKSKELSRSLSDAKGQSVRNLKSQFEFMGGQVPQRPERKFKPLVFPKPTKDRFKSLSPASPSDRPTIVRSSTFHCSERPTAFGQQPRETHKSLDVDSLFASKHQSSSALKQPPELPPKTYNKETVKRLQCDILRRTSGASDPLPGYSTERSSLPTAGQLSDWSAEPKPSTKCDFRANYANIENPQELARRWTHTGDCTTGQPYSEISASVRAKSEPAEVEVGYKGSTPGATVMGKGWSTSEELEKISTAARANRLFWTQKNHQGEEQKERNTITSSTDSARSQDAGSRSVRSPTVRLSSAGSSDGLSDEDKLNDNSRMRLPHPWTSVV